MVAMDIIETEGAMAAVEDFADNVEGLFCVGRADPFVP